VTPLSVAIEHDTRLGRPAAGAPLTLRGVRRSFGAKTVLDGVDLHVPAGQFLTVVGRSGCGKSTLLRLIAGLDEPTAGKIAIEGVSEGRARLARIMFQEPRLLPWARVTRMSQSASARLQTTHKLWIGRATRSLRSGCLTAPANGRQPCRAARSNASRLRARS
jgi:ABC-type nitrate/sulfonate/bicarbonate transport system ATPase subunit